MQGALYLAAFLLAAVGIAHSYLGERFILSRLAGRSSESMMRVLRFAWHITSVAWWGFAGMVVVLAHPPATPRNLGLVIGCTFLLHFAIVIVASRARHLSWSVFLAIGILVIYATR